MSCYSFFYKLERIYIPQKSPKRLIALGLLYRSSMFSHHDDNLYDHDLGLLSVSSPIHGVVFPIHDGPFAVHEYLCVVVHIIFTLFPTFAFPLTISTSIVTVITIVIMIMVTITTAIIRIICISNTAYS